MEVKYYLNSGVQDFWFMLRRFPLAWFLAWQDIRLRYRRSKLGPFWITISTGVMIAMIGMIFGQALNLPKEIYLPYVATGMIFWGFISSAINEGCTAFNSSAGMIRQIELPMSLYPLKMILRNIIVLGHNFVLLPIVLLVAGKGISWNLLLIVPGFILLLLNIFWMTLLLGVLCTRFRDMPPIVSSIVQVFFYLTPIIWMPDAVNARVSKFIVETNPFYHLLQLVRAPLLGFCPTSNSWILALILLFFGGFFSAFFFGKFKDRIAYWV